jgi:hypothetical protein
MPVSAFTLAVVIVGLVASGPRRMVLAGDELTRFHAVDRLV